MNMMSVLEKTGIISIICFSMYNVVGKLMFSASCCLLRQMVGAEYEGSNSKSKPLTHYEV